MVQTVDSPAAGRINSTCTFFFSAIGLSKLSVRSTSIVKSQRLVCGPALPGKIEHALNDTGDAIGFGLNRSRFWRRPRRQSAGCGRTAQTGHNVKWATKFVGDACSHAAQGAQAISMTKLL